MISETQRSFTYEWPGGQDLGSLTYEVQHPVGSQGMQIDPPPESTVSRPDGLVYSFADLGQVPGTETRQIQLSYQRESSALSIDTIGQTSPPVAGSPESAGTTPDVIAWLPFGLGGIGLLLVVVGGALYWRSRRRGSSAGARERRRPKRSDVARMGPALEPSVVFCHSCGTKAAIEPPLTRNISTDLLVIGAGYSGLWTALLAMEQNPSRDVVLVEAGEVATGASGRNGGFVDASNTHGFMNGLSRWPREVAILEKIGEADLAAIEATIKRLGIDCLIIGM